MFQYCAFWTVATNQKSIEADGISIYEVLTNLIVLTCDYCFS